MKNQSKAERLKGYVTRKYTKTDELVSKLDSCCEVGCNYCCHQSIEVINIEIPLIHEYIRQNIKGELFEKIKVNLSNWLDFFDNNTPDKTLKAREIFHDFLNISADYSLPCPFLINELCSIYEIRPFTCRVHVVTNNPELCNSDKLRMADDSANDFRQEVRKEIKRNMSDAYLIPLPFAVASIFLPNRKLKKIEKII